MKKQILLFALLMTFICYVSYSQNVSNELSTKSIKKVQKKIKSSNRFKEQLTTVALESIHISKGLEIGDIDAVKKFAIAVMSKLSQVENHTLSYKYHSLWYLSKMKMALRLKRIETSIDLENQKINFDEFNRELYRSLATTGLKKEKLYYMGCFKAFNDKSGYWFSERPVIINPYLNEEQSDCGFIAASIR